MGEEVDLVSRFHQVPPSYIDGRVQDGARMPSYIWRETLAGLVSARPPTDMATITAPTLIVWGARDELLTCEDQQALAAAIPASRFIVYQDTGHLVLWEQPGRVASDPSWPLVSLLPIAATPGPSRFCQGRLRVYVHQAARRVRLACGHRRP